MQRVLARANADPVVDPRAALGELSDLTQAAGYGVRAAAGYSPALARRFFED